MEKSFVKWVPVPNNVEHIPEWKLQPLTQWDTFYITLHYFEAEDHW